MYLSHISYNPTHAYKDIHALQCPILLVKDSCPFLWSGFNPYTGYYQQAVVIVGIQQYEYETLYPIKLRCMNINKRQLKLKEHKVPINRAYVVSSDYQEYPTETNIH